MTAVVVLASLHMEPMCIKGKELVLLPAADCIIARPACWGTALMLAVVLTRLDWHKGSGVAEADAAAASTAAA
jgi:hypothetical protein